MSDLLRWSKVEDEAGPGPVLLAPRLLSELPKAQGLPLALRECLIMDELVADGLASSLSGWQLLEFAPWPCGA